MNNVVVAGNVQTPAANLSQNVASLTDVEATFSQCMSKAGSLFALTQSDAVQLITAPESQVNNIFQTAIKNASTSVAFYLRYGGLFSRYLNGVRFGLPTASTAVDTASACSDEFDALKNGTAGYCSKAQTITEFSLTNPMLVSEIRIFANTANASQLTAGINTLQMQTDLTVTKSVVDVTQDLNMDDYRTNLIVIRPKSSIGWILSASRGIEFIVNYLADGTANFQITMKIAAQANAQSFLKV